MKSLLHGVAQRGDLPADSDDFPVVSGRAHATTSSGAAFCTNRPRTTVAAGLAR